jgi:F-type H+-transporting ATPase subunit b
MQVDWFTITAQIVNFLVLVYLLKRFLYGPIVNAMDRREKRVTDRLRDAQEREAGADRRADEFQGKSDELDQRRDQLLEQAREEAAQHRKELFEDARREVENMRRDWREELGREKDSFLRDLRSQAATSVASAARRALRALADVDLEERIVSTFHDRLSKLDEEEQARLADAIDACDEPLRIVTAFELSEGRRGALRDALEEQTGQPVELCFSESADLVCGIELRTPDLALAWSVDAFLGDVEEEIGEVLRQATRRDDDPSGEPMRGEDAEKNPPDEREARRESEA